MKYIGKDIELYGWVQKKRSLGGVIFIDLRDRSGIVQLVRPKKNGEIGCAEFYMYQNIYYCVGNEIYKIGQFDKKYEGRKYKQNIGLGIVRNSINIPGQKKSVEWV